MKEAVEIVTRDCECHLQFCDMKDTYMFSSVVCFYKWLYTEIKFHSELEGVNFENAKEAYMSWAKNSHPAEFNQLFMGFFRELLDVQKTLSKQELMIRIEGADFQVAAESITYTLREAEKKEGDQYIAKKEFKDATNHYIEKPCLERAVTLLEKYPSWLGLFELTKDPSVIKMRNFKYNKSKK